MKKIAFVFLVIVVVFMDGCIKDVEDKKFINESKPKLIVASFISPDDTTLIVYLRKTRPFFNDTSGRNYESVNDAQVILSDGNSSVSLKNLSVNNNTFTSKYIAKSVLLPIIPGKTYFLNVRTPSGLEIKSQCTIPIPVDVTSVTKLDSTIDPKIPKYTYYNFLVEWENQNNDPAYYGIESIYLDKNLLKNSGRDTSIRISKSRTAFKPHLSILKIDAGENSDGVFQVFKYLEDTVEFYSSRTAIGFNLLIFEKSFYEYSIYSTRKNTDFNPFYVDNQDTSTTPKIEGYPYSEPTTHYTNIEGGYGIFTGYVRVKKDLSL